MNILFIHEVDWLNKVVYDIHTLSESLAVLGHNIYVIDYENTWKNNSLFDFGTLKTKEITGVSRAVNGGSVTLRRPGFIKIPALSRYTAFFTHYFEIRRTIKEKKIDAIILYSVPTNGLQTISLARSFGIPVYFRSIDMLHILVKSPPLRAITRTLERLVYSQANMVLANTSQYQKYVIKMGAKESNVRLLPSQIDTKIFKPGVSAGNLKQKWGIKDNDQLVVFVGTLFDFSGLDEFVSHFSEILQKVPQAKLLIVGDGELSPKLEKLTDELRLKEKVIITGFQPYETMPQYINLASVCINTFLLTEKTNDIFPGKIMQYAACGKPISATSLRGISTILNGEQHGVLYAPTPARMIPDVIKLLQSPKLRTKLGKAALEQIQDKYSIEGIAKELEAILEGRHNKNLRT